MPARADRVPAPAPPRDVCLLRLSALGDVTHVLPLVHALQARFPGVALAWIVGKAEAKLLDGLPGVEFHVYDKASGAAGMRDLRARLAGRRFDALLLMQLAFRANLLSRAVAADRRIGYDRARSKELHGLFVDERIPAGAGPHVLDVLCAFGAPLGVTDVPREWRLPVPAEAHAWAAAQWEDDGRPMLAISPCSSHRLRNWRADRYAALADHAAAQGWRVVLLGGRSALERETADAIQAGLRHGPALDLVGRDTLKQLPALLARADLVCTPDSGPTHIANAMGTKVLGLHAATDPARSGPYSDRRYCVDRYDDAARAFLGRPAARLRWGTKIERDGVMDQVTVDDAVAAFERYRADAGR